MPRFARPSIPVAAPAPRLLFGGIARAVALGLAACLLPIATEAAGTQPPNIVVILLDDVGFSDFGCFGAEIHTPNIDRLARDGMRLTQFYSNPRCVPTRISLQTGRYVRRGTDREQAKFAGNVLTIGQALQSAGYRTVLSGKWDLGLSSPNLPNERGYDEYYGLLDSCSNYFDPMIRDPEFEGGRLRRWAHNGKLIEKFPSDFYATDAITDHAVSTIRRFAAEGRPFFAHVCYSAAHSPLHAKPADIAKYRGRYDAGWDVLREERRQRQRALGLSDSHWEIPVREPEVISWASEPNKDWSASLMEVYAAMVDCVDQGVGRIIAELERAGVADHTVVFVFSDNGGASSQAGGDDPANIPGPKEHYVSCGAGWAYVQNTPFRRFKGWCHEGGISVPLIVRWPGVVKAGAISKQTGHVIDFFPTLLEIARATFPSTWAGKPPEPLEGMSLVGAFRGNTPDIPRELFWTGGDSRAMREGRWKLAWEEQVRRWELYDLESDRTENLDLSSRDPERLKSMVDRWTDWARRTGAIDRPRRKK